MIAPTLRRHARYEVDGWSLIIPLPGGWEIEVAGSHDETKTWLLAASILAIVIALGMLYSSARALNGGAEVDPSPTPGVIDLGPPAVPPVLVPRAYVASILKEATATPTVPLPTLTPVPTPTPIPTRDYGESVNRWKPIVERYFPAELVDKALWVIFWESRGNPLIAGDNGCSIGLFQLNCRGVGAGHSVENLQDGEYNIALAASSVIAGGWGPWGEGRLYNGQVFGALGNHPYPGLP